MFSSHCIEHQPDLIGHLIDVAELLHPDGKYALIIPDARHCFDATLPLTKVSDILQAHYESRASHRPAAILEHWALTTHNLPGEHWIDSRTMAAEEWTQIDYGRLKLAEDKLKMTRSYVDVHAWQFSPLSFADIVGYLIHSSAVPFNSIECFGPIYGQNEFTCTLRL